MLSVKQKFGTPESFKPPFKADVSETYSARGEFHSAKSGLMKLKATLPWSIKSLLKMRNQLVERFGFETSFEESDFGPFDVNFPKEDLALISFDEPNFSFYGEILTNGQGIDGHFAVKFKTLKGRIYFYSIFPGHYLIFKYLMSRLEK